MRSDRSRNTVVLLSFTTSVEDPRVLRQVEALRDTYHLVTCGYGGAVGPDIPHLEIPEGTSWLPTSPIGLASLAVRAHKSSYAQIPAVKVVAELLSGYEFDLLLANDVETVPVALASAGRRPVVGDLHEFAPEQSDDWRWRLAMRPLSTEICRGYLGRLSGAMTVAPGIAQRYLDDFGLRAEVVINARSFQEPKSSLVARPLRLVHHGAALPDRELERMVNGVGDLEHATLDLFLVRSPRFSNYLDTLSKLTMKYENVQIRAAVPMADLPEVLGKYDLGLYILPPNSFNHEHALPNKIFDFIQSGLPMVIGPSPEMAALTEKYGLGLVLPDWEVETLRNALPRITTEQVEEWQANVCASAKELSSESGAEVIRDVVERALSAREPFE